MTTHHTTYSRLGLHEGRGLLVVQTQLSEQVVLNQVIVRVIVSRTVHQIAASDEQNAAVAAVHKLVVLDHGMHHVVREEYVVVAVLRERVVLHVDVLRAVHEHHAASTPHAHTPHSPVQRPVTAGRHLERLHVRVARVRERDAVDRDVHHRMVGGAADLKNGG